MHCFRSSVLILMRHVHKPFLFGHCREFLATSVCDLKFNIQISLGVRKAQTTSLYLNYVFAHFIIRIIVVRKNTFSSIHVFCASVEVLAHFTVLYQHCVKQTRRKNVPCVPGPLQGPSSNKLQETRTPQMSLRYTPLRVAVILVQNSCETEAYDAQEH